MADGLQPNPAPEEPETPPVAATRGQWLDPLALVHERLVVLAGGAGVAVLPISVLR